MVWVRSILLVLSKKLPSPDPFAPLFFGKHYLSSPGLGNDKPLLSLPQKENPG